MAAPTYMCPTCGSEVVVGEACPGCVPAKLKRKKKRGPVARRKPRSWKQDSIYDGLAIPDDEFDYEEFIEREFGNKPHRLVGIKWYWWVTGVGLLVLIIALILTSEW